jgi:NodT family efflux transporter outer membrane factor (OMF) lipoprotein
MVRFLRQPLPGPHLLKNPRSLWLCAAPLLLCGCQIGKPYVRPQVVSPPAFGELKGNDEWKVAVPGEGLLRGKWWEVFEDPQLNALEEQVAVNNYTVLQAEAQFRQALSLIDQNRASYYPTISTNPSVTQSDRGINSGREGTADTFSLPFNVTWTPDLWGRVRLAVESTNASTQAQAALLENVRLSLQSTLAASYFGLLGTDMQLSLLNDTIAAYQTYLTLTNNRFNGGVASKADVSLAETQLYTTQASAVDLGVARNNFEHAIAVLIGKPPSELSIERGKINAPPPPIPVGVPSALLERRPDIAAQERNMMVANANIGLQETAYYPTLTLSAQAGLSSGSALNLFSYASRLWSAGPSLSQTLYDAGRRNAQMRGVEAAYDATVASYRQTVLTAFQQVEDNLSALRVLAEESILQARAVDSANQSLQLETERYRAGTDSYLNVVTVQAIALNNQRTAVTLLQRRLTSAVALIAALGGGWDQRNLPTNQDLKNPDLRDPANTKKVAVPTNNQ